MKGTRKGRVNIPRSVSFPPALIEQAEQRAAELQLTFSAYVQRCVAAEMEGRLLVVYREDLPHALPLVAEDRPPQAATPPARASRAAGPRSKRPRSGT